MEIHLIFAWAVVAYLCIAAFTTLVYAAWTEDGRDEDDPSPIRFGLSWGLNALILIIRLTTRNR